MTWRKSISDSKVFSIDPLLMFETRILAIGVIAERGCLGPLLAVVFVWSTLVYDPIACWTWNLSRWSGVLGGFNFAGGTPVHINSSTAALLR